MIISASRRTDIPAFYSEWFMERVKQGYATVANPFNRNQISYVSLAPEDVDVIVFWTKNARPLLGQLDGLDKRGYRYYFQYTVNGYPECLEARVPSIGQTVDTISRLAERIGSDKIIWRYDPIVISNVTDYDYHIARFAELAKQLRSSTRRVVISVVDNYRKAATNFKKMAEQGIHVQTTYDSAKFAELMHSIVAITKTEGLEIFSCAEVLELSSYGILPGKCIDDKYIARTFGINAEQRKDKSQRPECGCVQSKDIGFYDTCMHGCSYCYAGTVAGGIKNQGSHSLASPSLLGWYNAGHSYDT